MPIQPITPPGSSTYEVETPVPPPPKAKERIIPTTRFLSVLSAALRPRATIDRRLLSFVVRLERSTSIQRAGSETIRLSPYKAQMFDAVAQALGMGEPPESNLSEPLRQGLAFYLQEEGQDLSQLTFSIWQGLGKQPVSFSKLLLRQCRLLLEGKDPDPFSLNKELQNLGSFHLLALGLIQYLEKYDPENPIGARALQLAAELTDRMDAHWGNRLAWDKSLAGVRRIGLDDFERRARNDLGDETFERIKSEGKIFYGGGIIIRKYGDFEGQLRFLTVPPPPLKTDSDLVYVWIGFQWKENHWEIVWSRGNHRKALTYFFEKGPLASPDQDPKSQFINRKSMKLVGSLDELKTKPADFLTTETTRFLNHPPDVGTRIMIYRYSQKDGNKTKESLFLNVNMKWLSSAGLVILFFDGERWEVEWQWNANKLVEALTANGAHKRETTYSPDRVALREKPLLDTPVLAPVIREVKDFLRGQGEPGSHFRHQMTLAGEGSFDLFGFRVPEEKERGVGEAYPSVTPDGPKNFLMLRIRSDAGIPASYMVLHPTPQGFALIESAHRSLRPWGLESQLGILADLNSWVYEQALREEPTLLKSRFHMAIFNDSIHFLFPYFFRTAYLETHSPLKAFLAARDQLKTFDDTAPLLYSSLQVELKKQKYDHYGLTITAQCYEYWHEAGVDLDTEFDALEGQGSNFTEILDALTALLKPLGLPPGLASRGSYSLRSYLYFTLRALGKTKNKNDTLFLNAQGEIIEKRMEGEVDPLDSTIVSIGQLLRSGILSSEEATLALRLSEGAEKEEVARELGLTTLAFESLKRGMAKKLIEEGVITVGGGTGMEEDCYLGEYDDDPQPDRLKHVADKGHHRHAIHQAHQHSKPAMMSQGALMVAAPVAEASAAEVMAEVGV